MNIRPMLPADIARVMEIANHLDLAPHWPAEVYVQALDPRAVPQRVALVADYPQAGVLGFLVAVLIPPQTELETIVVATEAQRQGIARRLFGEFRAILQERHITEVMLEVRESNRAARAFYRSLDFIETGRRAGYYAHPKEDAILLERLVGEGLRAGHAR